VALPLWQEILGSSFIVAFFALLGEGVSRLLHRVGKRAGLKETTLFAIRDAIRVIWVVLAVIGVAFYANLASELTVLAVSTVGGLIVWLALQSTLSNVIAGLFMLQDGTLRVGDEVTFSSIKGKVVRVSLRSSWIMTHNGAIAVVSNSNLLSGPLINRTATTRLVTKYHLHGEVPLQASGVGVLGDLAERRAPGRKARSDGTFAVQRLPQHTDPSGDPAEP
jgi:small-conductance mechanosensitive channel